MFKMKPRNLLFSLFAIGFIIFRGVEGYKVKIGRQRTTEMEKRALLILRMQLKFLKILKMIIWLNRTLMKRKYL
jgi:hypothetical protein